MKKITGNHMNEHNNNTISGVLNCYHELVERKGEVHSECSGLIIPVSENIIKTRSVYDTSSFIADNETIYGQ